MSKSKNKVIESQDLDSCQDPSSNDKELVYKSLYSNKCKRSRQDYIETSPHANYISRKAIIQESRYVELQSKSIIESHVIIRGDLAKVSIGRYCYIDSYTMLLPCDILYEEEVTVSPTKSKEEVSDNMKETRTATSTATEKENEKEQETSSILIGEKELPKNKTMTSVSGTESSTSDQTKVTVIQQKRKKVPMTIGSMTSIGSNCQIKAAYIGSYVQIGPNVQIGARTVIKDNVIIEANTIIPPDSIIPPFAYVKGKPFHIAGEVSPAYLSIYPIRRKHFYVNFFKSNSISNANLYN